MQITRSWVATNQGQASDVKRVCTIKQCSVFEMVGKRVDKSIKCR